MENRFESLYPDNSRFEEIEKIFKLIKEGNSVELISLPGVGRSNLLGLLSFNRNVRIAHVGKDEQAKYHFVLLDFSEMRRRPLIDVTKFLFLSLVDSLRERNILEDYQKIDQLFKESIASQDELVIFQGLKKTIDFLSLEKDLTVVFLFDRFEDYVTDVTPEFFTNLRVLRNRAKYKFSVVFSLNRPITQTIEEAIIKDFYEFIDGNDVFLPIEDEPGLFFRLDYLKKNLGEEIDQRIIDEIIKLCAGHGKLTRIALEAYLSVPEVKEELSTFLLSKKRVLSVLHEIWKAFTPEEQKLLKNVESENEVPDFFEEIFIVKNKKITIPLFEKYVKSQTNDSSVDEGLIFDPDKNEIRRGEIVYSNGLTKSEFKLLKFLIQSPGRIISRDEIINSVWGDLASTQGVTEQALDQLIFRLRKKIETEPNSPKMIQTIKGRGIQFSS